MILRREDVTSETWRESKSVKEKFGRPRSHIARRTAKSAKRRPELSADSAKECQRTHKNGGELRNWDGNCSGSVAWFLAETQLSSIGVRSRQAHIVQGIPGLSCLEPLIPFPFGCGCGASGAVG
jgi:hypothetical protein